LFVEIPLVAQAIKEGSDWKSELGALNRFHSHMVRFRLDITQTTPEEVSHLEALANFDRLPGDTFLVIYVPLPIIGLDACPPRDRDRGITWLLAREA
jgi:hypothetical protein